MRKYRLVAKKGEGTFSEVLKAQNVKDGKYYAIKCMKNRFDSIDQVSERATVICISISLACRREFRHAETNDRTSPSPGCVKILVTPRYIQIKYTSS